MEKYIGLDAHSSTCRFCITDERGREINEAVTSLQKVAMLWLEDITCEASTN